jgi:hypothetical protein
LACTEHQTCCNNMICCGQCLHCGNIDQCVSSSDYCCTGPGGHTFCEQGKECCCPNQSGQMPTCTPPPCTCPHCTCK